MNTEIYDHLKHREINQGLKALRLDIRRKRKLSAYKRRLTTTDHTLADLERMARSEPRTMACPTRLPLNHILIAEKVFQWRREGSDPIRTEGHIRSLTNAINGYQKGVPGKMDPPLVMAVGASWFCVDGHHRLEAYRRSKWTKSIPVHIFKGTIEQGRHLALRSNKAGKLGLNTNSLSEAAWDLVKQGTLSKADIAALAGRSERLVASMRARLRDDPATRDLTWSDALYGHSRRGPIDHAGKDAKAVQKVVAKLVKLGVKFPAPSVFAKAIASLDEDLPARLISCWPEVARRVLKHYDARNICDL